MKDTRDDRSFERDVYDVVRAIPKGRVTSYGAIAKLLGAARASRRVGWVLNKSIGRHHPCLMQWVPSPHNIMIFLRKPLDLLMLIEMVLLSLEAREC